MPRLLLQATLAEDLAGIDTALKRESFFDYQSYDDYKDPKTGLKIDCIYHAIKHSKLKSLRKLIKIKADQVSDPNPSFFTRIYKSIVNHRNTLPFSYTCDALIFAAEHGTPDTLAVMIECFEATTQPILQEKKRDKNNFVLG